MSKSEGRPAPRGSARARLGAAGERLATQLLERLGMSVLEHNWRCPYGEVDIILRDGPELVFVEVKTRRGIQAGSPEEAVTPLKRRRLVATAQTYLMEHDAEQHPYRIDVVAVELESGGKVRHLRHYPRAIAEEQA